MAPKKKAAPKPELTKQDTVIVLPKLKRELMEVTLIGDTPIIVHAWSLKAKRMMLAKHMQLPEEAKGAKDPRQDFEDSLYKLDDGTWGFPSVAFKCAAVTACTSVAGVTKVAARQAFNILGDDIEVDGAFEGIKVRQNLVRILGGLPRMREDMVRVSNGQPDIRYRGEFSPWACKVLVRFNGNVLSPSQLLNLLNTAGMAVGVGEWRNEKDGQYGLFHVAEEGEFESLMASVKPLRKAA